MARLLTVVNERKKLRNEYRKHLEDEYIAEAKSKEKVVEDAKREEMRAQGLKVPPTVEEQRAFYAKKAEKNKEAISKALEEAKSIQAASGAVIGDEPLLNDKDLMLIATTKVKLSQTDILKMYVKNWAELDLKQRRKVMGHINAQRSAHAKEVFLKELSTIGKKFQKQEHALVENSRVLNKKDPLKLRLENISS